MIRNPRHQEILSLLTMLRQVSVQELSQRLNVSEVTVRKDLTFLEEAGCLMRTRGGAQIAEDSRLLKTIDIRQREHLDKKEQIASKAKELIHDGETIYLDSGSTCYLLARQLRDMSLRVVTNSIDVMVELADAPAIQLFSLGGSYRKEAGSFIGPIAINTLQNFQIETCFIGATGFSAGGVFSSQNIIETQLKQRVLEASERRIIVADSSKFGKVAFSIFARAETVDILVTDSDFTHARELGSLGIEVVTAQHHQVYTLELTDKGSRA